MEVFFNKLSWKWEFLLLLGYWITDNLLGGASKRTDNLQSGWLFVVVKMRDQPLANCHPEGPASYKWWSGGTGLLQMVIRRDRPLADGHPEGQASCKWWSGGAGLLQMIIRRAAAVRGGIGDSSSCMKIDFFLRKTRFSTHRVIIYDKKHI